MPDIEYRVFFNNRPATREQLDRIEEITVEQEVDVAWEARIQIPICTDDQGNWRNEDEDSMRSFSRVRVEIKNDEPPFVPLIDGPIVESDTQMSSEPGQSSITLIVHDDSVYLNREERISRFDDMSDHEIAREIFDDVEQIASVDIEETPEPGSELPPAVVQRGTAMQILRSLARRQGKHAYVLPGEQPGRSVGVFKSFPAETDGLPQFILLGTERNIERFEVRYNAQRPSTVSAATLSITDKVVITRRSHFRNLELLGEEAAFENEADTATEILPPHQGEAVDLEQAVTAGAAASSYAFEATGSVRGHCYRGILQPYRVVSVGGVNSRLSGNYLIAKVTHTLTRSNYSQSFTVRRNARSSGSGRTARDRIEEIF